MSTIIIFLLYALANRENKNKNGFSRNLLQASPLPKLGELDLDLDSYYISGTSSKHIYLTDMKNPAHTLVATFDLLDTSHLKLNAPQPNIIWKAINIEIDSPDVYMSEKITKTFSHTTLNKSKTWDNRKFDSTDFDILIPIDNNHLLMRAYAYKLKQNILKKVSLSPEEVHEKDFTLKKMVDGKFCTDGSMKVDRVQKRLVYLYYYRNEFSCLDYNLDLIYHANTIDTTTTPKIKVGTILRSVDNLNIEETMLSAPPKIVNKRMCIAQGHVFIHSALQGDNEDEGIFKRNEVIDVYSLENGTYRCSFYLPKCNGSNLIDLWIEKGIIVTMYDHYLITFKLPQVTEGGSGKIEEGRAKLSSHSSTGRHP